MHKNILAAQHKKEGHHLINAVKSGDAEAIKKVFKDHFLTSILIVNIDIEDLAEAIATASNKILNLLNDLFEERYRSSNIGEFLANDMDNLNTLAKYLKIKIK
ncbi:hypothetical protein LWM68_08035 [Niabella sp. W65]|nr:hypothetical protein [Niabella sp. W65]MCH7362716.1 hypothetical protein [Niabella sp. W65]